MHSLPILVGTLGLLSSVASASSAATCFTRYERTPGPKPIKTTTHTSYNTDCTTTKTSTKIKTVTQKGPVSTYTVTALSVSTASTAGEIPEPSGFQTIQDTLPSATYIAPNPPQKRDLQPAELEYERRAAAATPSPLANVRVYPNGVDCYVNGGDLCKTKSTTTTSTYTKPPTTKVKTKTVVTTSTSTTYTTSSLAACATSNMANYVGDRPIDTIRYNNTYTFTGYYLSYNPISAYDCCAVSFTLPYADMWYYYQDLENPNSQYGQYCYVYYTNATICANEQDTNNQWYSVSEYQCDFSVTIGNTPCGVFNYNSVADPSSTSSACSTSTPTPSATPSVTATLKAKRAIFTEA